MFGFSAMVTNAWVTSLAARAPSTVALKLAIQSGLDCRFIAVIVPTLRTTNVDESNNSPGN
jgi:hypothetical protein